MKNCMENNESNFRGERNRCATFISSSIEIIEQADFQLSDLTGNRFVSFLTVRHSFIIRLTCALHDGSLC